MPSIDLSMRLATVCAAAMVLVGCASSPHPPSATPLARRSVHPVSPQAQDSEGVETPTGEYIEYRYLPELGKITIADGSVRGEQSLAYLKNHTQELVARGIFPCTDNRPHAYRRSEKAGGHTIEMAVLITPSTSDAGSDEDDGTQRLIVQIDGRRKIDCTIGSTADGEMWVAQVALFPEDGTFHIVALSSEGEELDLPDEWERFDNPIVITDQSFFEDEPDVTNQPVKV